MAISASLVVSFGGGAGNSMLVAELDDTKNNDKTSFLTSETCYFSIYKYPSSIQVSTPVPSSGMVTDAGFITRTKTERLDFINTQSVALSYPPAGPVTVVRWYGNVGNDFTISGFSANISNSIPCICDVSYQTQGALWELHPPNNIDLSEVSEYPIIVLIIGEDV